ncbi:redoxin domain-containing protein [Actinopolyspora lacussalsi]|uniref:redoxin domain-containing protein n=1 Tax=Actinopolyspora righensis TaxID=995060 RepID=UPI001C31BE0A
MTAIPPPVPAPRPATKVPELSVPLVGGGQWNIREQLPSTFTMVVCYRGPHCPACRGQLREVDECFPDLASRGVEAVAISANDRASASGPARNGTSGTFRWVTTSTWKRCASGDSTSPRGPTSPNRPTSTNRACSWSPRTRRCTTRRSRTCRSGGRSWKSSSAGSTSWCGRTHPPHGGV